MSYLRFHFASSLEFIVFGGITIIFSSVFKKEQYIKLFISTYTIIGTLISIHALFQLILSLTGFVYYLDFNWIDGRTLGTIHYFSPIFGVFDSFEFNLLRISSFFNEANRLGYFLLPLVFIHFNYKSKYSAVLLSLFGLTILLTKSFATFGILFLLRIIYYKKYRFIFLSLFLIFIYIISLQVNCSFNFECTADTIDLSTQINRTRSIASRLASFYHLTNTLIANPFGVGLAAFEELTLIAPTYTAVVYWSLIGGWISIFSIVSLIFCIIFRNINFIYNNPASQYKGLCIGLIGYSILELFMGTGFTGLFNLMAALSLALPVSKRLSWI